MGTDKSSSVTHPKVRVHDQCTMFNSTGTPQRLFLAEPGLSRESCVRCLQCTAVYKDCTPHPAAMHLRSKMA